RDRQLDRAGPGIPVPAPVAVAGVRALLGPDAVLGAAHRIGLGTHQRLHERGDHLPQQIRTRLTQLLSQPTGQVDTRWCGHRVARRSRTLVGSLEGSRGGRLTSRRHAQRRESNTTSTDATATAHYSPRIPGGLQPSWAIIV